MPVLFINVLVNTARSPFSSLSGMTTPATPVQYGIAGHIGPVTSTSMQYKALPQAALESDYAFNVDAATDIREEDIVTSITLLDGVTPWPEQGLPTNTNETFRVTYIYDSAPGPLASRTAYIARIRGGGAPAYSA